MDSVSAISAIQNSPTSAAAYLPLIQSLQSQLLLYSQFATGSSPAAVDFKALQYDITTGNYTDGQVELSRLQRDSVVGSSTGATLPATSSASDSAISNAAVGTADSNVPASGSLINVTA